MLGDLQLRLWQIEDLATLDIVGRLLAQRPAAVRATLDRMPYRAVGLLDHAQGMARIGGLPARWPLTLGAQTLGLGQPL